MENLYTHWEFEWGMAILVIRENMTSNFAKAKRYWFTMEQYREFQKSVGYF